MVLTPTLGTQSSSGPHVQREGQRPLPTRGRWCTRHVSPSFTRGGSILVRLGLLRPVVGVPRGIHPLTLSHSRFLSTVVAELRQALRTSRPGPTSRVSVWFSTSRTVPTGVLPTDSTRGSPSVPYLVLLPLFTIPRENLEVTPTHYVT